MEWKHKKTVKVWYKVNGVWYKMCTRCFVAKIPELDFYIVKDKVFATCKECVLKRSKEKFRSKQHVERGCL